MNPAPLILIPGMGADARIFRAQQAAFPHVRVPAWIAPRPREALIDYAHRFADAIDPHAHEPCFLGGASFGGVIALEVAARLNTRAVFLIGSLRSPGALAWHVRAARPIARLAFALPYPLLASLARVSLSSAGRYSSIATRSLLVQIADADGGFLRWATRSLLEWQPSKEIGALRIGQIHGAKDRVLPAHLSGADEIVPGAGHLLSVTHGDAVNRFIAARIS